VFIKVKLDTVRVDQQSSQADLLFN